MDLWFKTDNEPASPEDQDTPVLYDRLSNLKSAFFKIFADHSTDLTQLDYVNMVIVFNIHASIYLDFLFLSFL